MRAQGDVVAVWRALAEVPADLGRTVATIGVFDGVHLGHQAVIGTAAKHAQEAGLPLVVITFDPNPLAVVRPDVAPPSIVGVDRRAELLVEAGADHVLVLTFDRDRAGQSAADFVDDVLVGQLSAQAVVVGADFRFGHKAAGDVALLAELGADRGFTVEALDMVGDTLGDRDLPRYSSTLVRESVRTGDVAIAARVLGRPHRVQGGVVRGDGRGRSLGFPTANVPVSASILVPADGVYAGWLTRLDRPGDPALPAAISVGTNPTFGESARRVESYVLDRDDLELYDIEVAVDFVERIRGQVRFDSADALVEKMHMDVAATRDALGV